MAQSCASQTVGAATEVALGLKGGHKEAGEATKEAAVGVVSREAAVGTVSRAAAAHGTREVAAREATKEDEVDGEVRTLPSDLN